MNDETPIDYQGPYVEPVTGVPLPENIVPRDPYVQGILETAANEWWDGLTLAQKLGLVTRHS